MQIAPVRVSTGRCQRAWASSRKVKARCTISVNVALLL